MVGLLETIKKQQESAVRAKVSTVNLNCIKAPLCSDTTITKPTRCIFEKSGTFLKWCNSSKKFTKQKSLSPDKLCQLFVCVSPIRPILIFFNLQSASWAVPDRAMTASECRSEFGTLDRTANRLRTQVAKALVQMFGDAP